MEKPDLETQMDEFAIGADDAPSADSFFDDVEAADSATVPQTGQAGFVPPTTPDNGSTALEGDDLPEDELPEGASAKTVAAYRKMQSERDRLQRQYDELFEQAKPALALWNTASVDPRLHATLKALYEQPEGAESAAPNLSTDDDEFDFLPEAVRQRLNRLDAIERDLDVLRQQHLATQFQQWRAVSEQEIDAMARDKLLPFGVELSGDQRDSILALSLQNGVPLDQAFWAVVGPSVSQRTAATALKPAPKERDAHIRRAEESLDMLGILNEVSQQSA